MSKNKIELDNTIQEKVLQLQALDDQLKQLEQQAGLVDERINELQVLIVSLDELKKAEEKSSILAPIGKGVFVGAKLENKSFVWLDVGKNVVIKKPVDKAKDFLEKKLQELVNVRNSISQNATIIINQISKLEKELKASGLVKM